MLRSVLDAIAHEIFGTEYAELTLAQANAMLTDAADMIRTERSPDMFLRMSQYREDIGAGGLSTYCNCLLAQRERVA